MLNTDHAPTTRFWNPERKAWAVMLVAFGIFCALAWTTTRVLYHYAIRPSDRIVRAMVVQPDAVFVQRADRVQTVGSPMADKISTGDRITTSTGAWPGIVARLATRPGDGRILARDECADRQPRSLQFALQLDEGQVVVELQRDDQPLYFTTKTLAQEIELTAPGRYRLRVLTPTAKTTAAAERSTRASGRGRQRKRHCAYRRNIDRSR